MLHTNSLLKRFKNIVKPSEWSTIVRIMPYGSLTAEKKQFLA